MKGQGRWRLYCLSVSHDALLGWCCGSRRTSCRGGGRRDFHENGSLVPKQAKEIFDSANKETVRLLDSLQQGASNGLSSLKVKN